MSARTVADMPAEWRRWHPYLTESRPVCCDMPMEFDADAGGDRHYCIECGCVVGSAGQWEELTLGYRPRLSARDRRITEQEDAAAYERENPLREYRP